MGSCIERPIELAGLPPQSLTGCMMCDVRVWGLMNESFGLRIVLIFQNAKQRHMVFGVHYLNLVSVLGFVPLTKGIKTI